MTRIRAALRWVYEWATVLTAALVGGASVVFELLDVFAALDLTPILPPAHAAKIITFVAIAKALAAFVRSRQ